MTITWTNHRFGSGADAKVGRVGTISYSWEGEGYRITVLGRRLKNRPTTECAARNLAVVAARQILAEATLALADQTMELKP